MAVNHHTMTTSVANEYLPPFAMPGPVLPSVGDLVFSAVSEQAKTKTQTAYDLPVATDDLVNPVAKPGPVFLSVPEPVLSRASEAKATRTNDVRDFEPTANAFTRSPFTLTIIHDPNVDRPTVPDTAFSHISENTKIHTRNGRDVATTSTSIVIDGPLKPDPTPSAPPLTQNISTAMIGWIIAILVACVMTGLSLWLIIRSYSARARARSRRAANVRRSRGAEMLAAGR